MKRIVIIIMLLLSFVMVNASPIEDTLHLNMQVTTGTGAIQPGTYNFSFRVTEDANCTTPVHIENVQLTTDSRGIINYYLTNLSSLDFQSQYWLCSYRNNVLKDIAKIARTPYSFTVKNETDPLWTLEKTNYYNKTEIDNLLLSINITGNISLTDYYNKSEVDALISNISLTPGPPGINGTNGIDGLNGTNGVDGLNGTNGIDGLNGTTFYTGGPYLYDNGSNVIYFNDTPLYSIFLTGYNETDPFFSAWNYDWSNLTNVPAGFADGIDNDTKYSNLSEFINDAGFITGYNETDPIFSAANSTLLKTTGAQSLNGTLDISGQTAIGGGFPNGGITLTDSGDIWMDGSLYLTGNISSVNITSVGVNGSFYPVLDATFNSGDSAHRWLNLYTVHLLASDANITGALYAGSLHGSLNANDVANPPWLTSFTEADPIFVANNASLWAAINSKLNITDQRYNDTAAFQAADNALNATIQSLNTSFTMAYGGIYFSAATTSMTLTTGGIWYNFTNWTLGESLDCSMGADNGSLQCSPAGMYRISYVVNNDINSADTLEYHLLINGVAEDKSFIAQKMTSGSAQSAVNYFHRRLNANDTIRLQVQNTGTNGKVLNIYNKNIIIERIGS